MLRLFRSLLLLALVPAAAIPILRVNAATKADYQGNEFAKAMESLTLEELPVATESGSFELQGLRSMQWNKGDRPIDYFSVGLLDDLGVTQMTLNQIAEYSGQDLSNAPLSSFELLHWQSIGDLQAIPYLKDYRVGDVAPILDTVGEEYRDQLIGQLPPEVQGYLLKDLDSFSLKSIPNVMNTELAKFRGADYSKASGVPGLGKVPISQLEGYASPLVWGKMDLPLLEEAQLTSVISGAYGHDRQWKTHSTCKENCPHAELGNYTPGFNFAGKQWLSMETNAPGGWGVLQWVNGGKEAHGMHPFGKAFKVALEVDDKAEDKGRVKVWWLWRYCQREPFTGRKIGCTPYGGQDNIAKTPWFPVKENGVIPIGAQGYTENLVKDASNSLVASARGAVAGESSFNIPPPTSGNNPSIPGDNSPFPGEPEYNGQGNRIASFKNGSAGPPPPACSGGHSNPLPGYPITSPYGPRWGRIHRGTDQSAPNGTPIQATRDGVVKTVQGLPNSTGWGKYVKLFHPCDGTYTLYAHMNEFANVKVGQKVKRGQVIGYVGSTGRSTGPHLHFVVFKDGKKVNPEIYVRF